jgi:putative proteasome-type protease
MTYCLGVKLRDGLICLADGRITSGNQVSVARKVSLHGPDDGQVCIMTSGLRSLRDKTIAYLEQEISGDSPGAANIIEVLDTYTRCLRRVAEEDQSALEASQLSFDLTAIIAGQIGDDPSPLMFLIYPEGNWVEVTERTPYISIGATAYGKPIMDRMLDYETSLELGLQVAFLSFDSTRVSTADVGFPLDMLTFTKDRRWREIELDSDDVDGIRQWWNDSVTKLAANMPAGPWAECLLPEGELEDTST